MYRTVTATLLKCREASIIIKVKNRPGEHVIPRTAVKLHGEFANDGNGCL